jgi:MerR family transcriptional regulator, thiopeptide resistance regulator
MDATWKVGELAAATGLTVRTLHHYDAIGLLAPSERTSAGYRLYGTEDVERLYRICLLRRLGLSLTEMAAALDEPEWSLRPALRRHHAELDRRLTLGRRLQRRLVAMTAALDRDDMPSAEDLLGTLEEMTMLETVVQKRITLLVYADIEAAHDYLVNVFGLGAGQLSRDDAGTVLHGEVEAGDGVIWMHRVSREYGLDSPRSLGASSAALMVMVDDVDAHFARVREAGGDIVYEPVDQPYGVREYSARDPEGFLWSFASSLG